MKLKSMRIGLISDTHIPLDAKRLPPQVEDVFKGVDLILHAGDIYIPRVLDELGKIAPVLSARGNGDSESLKDDRIQGSHVLDVARLRLGITHIIYYPETTFFPLDKAMSEKFGGRMDIVVFGDTHVPLVQRHNGILMVNPGSPTLPSNLHQLGTVGLLEASEGSAEARIIQLDGGKSST